MIRISRRHVLQLTGGVLIAQVWPRVVLAATPACAGGHDDPTPRMIEGPYYTPETPERQMLRAADTIGTPLTVEGRVLGTDCKPIAGALIDVWNADGDGVYDNAGYKLRGHQFTDESGAFLIDTVKPGDYGPQFARRTPHIHVKVKGPSTQVLTTQLYFPGEKLNLDDELFKKALLMDVRDGQGGALAATFDFVLRSA